jgi:nucleotide-binding universal stress UspA family protein
LAIIKSAGRLLFDRRLKMLNMKSIIVLTDFSANAACAAETALILAGKLRADILLYNTCIAYETTPLFAGGTLVDEVFLTNQLNSKIGLEYLAKRLKLLSFHLRAADYKPAIAIQSDASDLVLDAANIISQNNVELVVMGAHSDIADDFMPGEDTYTIIKNSPHPVLVIPADTDIAAIHKVIFATDFDEADINAIHYLVKLCKLFNYQLEIIHIAQTIIQQVEGAKEHAFKKQLARLKYPGLTYQKVNGEEVVDTLNYLIEQSGPAILSMLHQSHSFLARVFEHSETKTALSKQKIPLLVFPSK